MAPPARAPPTRGPLNEPTSAVVSLSCSEARDRIVPRPALRGLRLAVLIGLLYLLAPPSASAQNVVALTPPAQELVQGQIASLDLEIDFTDPSLGGGIVVEFDTSRLGFLGFSFDPTAPDDPALRLVCPSAAPACASFPGPGVLVAFAVDTVGFPAISGAHVIGTLDFSTPLPGTAPLSTREDDSVAGPLVGVTSFDPPSLGTATVDIVDADSVPGLGATGVVVLATGLGLAGMSALRGVRGGVA